MRPLLTVEGIPHEVRAITYFEGNVHDVMISNGETLVTYYDERYAQQYVEKPLKLDMDECLRWQGRYDEVYQTLDKAINDKAVELQELAIENIETKQPFTPNDIQQKYFYMQREQMGLIDAQEIVHGFMVDDVDLTGGEDVGS